MGKVLLVVAAVIFDGDEVLACRRNADRDAGGRWEFPGGKVELGEDPVSALIREVHEELGIEIDVVEELRTDETKDDGVVIRLTCFSARLREHRPFASTDHDQLLWLTTSELATLDWAPADVPMVRQLQATRENM